MSKADFEELCACVEKANAKLGPSALREMEAERERRTPEKDALIREIVAALLPGAGE